MMLVEKEGHARTVQEAAKPGAGSWSNGTWVQVQDLGSTGGEALLVPRAVPLSAPHPLHSCAQGQPPRSLWHWMALGGQGTPCIPGIVNQARE